MIILSILLLALSGLLYYSNFDQNNRAINNIVSMFRTKKVVVPKESYNQLNYNFATIKPTNEFIPKNMDDIKSIYYTILNNGWKEFTFYCPKEYPKCINDVIAFANDNEGISLLNNYVNPYNSYKKIDTLVIGDDEVYITIEKLYADSEKQFVDENVDNILKELKIKKEKVSITDIKNIHNYLLKLITYDDEYNGDDEHTITNKAYGALTTKKALCSGYSDLFAIILNELDIPNFKVTSEDHVWNAIYFNKKWSHIDVTWDDDEVNDNNTYNFFMIDTDDLLNKDTLKHNFNKELYLELQ